MFRPFTHTIPYIQMSERVSSEVLREDQKKKALKLGNEVQNSIRDERLVPAVRTVYRRCAFQSSHSNAVRMITPDYA